MKLTLILILINFFLSFSYNGIVLYIPKILMAINNTKITNNYSEIAFSIFSEIPSSILCFFLIENSYFGRRKSLLYLTFFSSISALCCFFIPQSGFGIFAGFSRFFFNSSLLILVPFVFELYPTTSRVTATGLFSGISVLTGIFMPWIIGDFSSKNARFTFLLFSIGASFSFMLTLFIKEDTLGRDLDDIDRKRKNKLKLQMLMDS